jgi:hypothetical protein
MAKTTVHLKRSASIWLDVEKWAEAYNYTLETQAESTREYLRNSPEASAQIHVEISQVDMDVKIQAWFSDLIRKELEIDSASIYAALPRKEAVGEINNLLTALGTAPPKQQEKKKKRNLAFNLGRSIRKISGKNK